MITEEAINKSHLTRGAWIEMSTISSSVAKWFGRTSHEVRGLKYEIRTDDSAGAESHLTRGAWIEIIIFPSKISVFFSRTSHEVRGLKCARAQ